MVKTQYTIVPYLALYLVSYGLFYSSCSTKSATHWRLCEKNGVQKIVAGEVKRELFEADPLFDLLMKANPPKYQTSLTSNASKRFNVAAGVG